MATFVVSDSDDRAVFSPAMPVTALTGHPYLTHIAPLALFNPTGSGKTLRVRRVDVLPLMAQTTATPGTLDVYRITAHAGALDTLAATRIDSSSAALPAQVVLARRPSGVTTTGAQLDVQRAQPLANDTRALGHAFAAAPWAARMGRLDATTAELQRLVLREGEGLAVSLAGVSGLPYRFMVTLQVRVAATGALHAWSFTVTPDSQPLFSLLNGSGSGVVLELVSLAYMEIGTDVAPQISIEPIDAIDGGDVLTLAAMDSTESPGAIVARRNAVVLMRGSKAGALVVTPQTDWVVPVGFGVGVNVANLMGRMPFWRPRGPHAPELDIVLREGEGLAVIYRTPGSPGRCRHAITFCTSGPVYPAEGDVRLDVDYGPAGNDYTGTLVVGGGGSGYSRGRVVNA